MNLPWFTYRNIQFKAVHRRALRSASSGVSGSIEWKWLATYAVLTIFWPSIVALYSLEGLLQVSRRAQTTPVSRVKQCYQLFWLGLRKNLAPKTYYGNCLWKLPHDDLDGVIQHTELLKILARQRIRGTAESNILDRKTDLCRKLAQNNIDATATRAMINTNTSLDKIEGHLNSFAVGSRLFLKYDCGFGGVGAESWTRADLDLWKFLEQGLSTSELSKRISKKAVSGELLLQDFLLNHRNVQGLSNGALCTLRLVTFSDGSSDPIPMAAVWRMPRGNMIVDNFSSGGIAAGVLPTGILTAGRSQSEPWLDVVHHPDTGSLIQGQRLVFFEEARALASDCHKLFSDVPSVGWDIAITNTGPTVIEANSQWGGTVLQVAHRQPLLKLHPAMPRCLTA